MIALYCGDGNLSRCCEPGGDGQVGHRLESGTDFEDRADDVERHGAGGEVAVDAAGDSGRERRLAFDPDLFVGLGLADGGPEGQRDDLVITHKSPADLIDAADHAFGNRLVARFDLLLGHDRFDALRDSVDLPAEPGGDEIHRFRQAHVPQRAGVALGLEFLYRQAGADLLLEWDPADGRILDAQTRTPVTFWHRPVKTVGR